MEDFQKTNNPEANEIRRMYVFWQNLLPSDALGNPVKLKKRK